MLGGEGGRPTPNFTRPSEGLSSIVTDRPSLVDCPDLLEGGGGRPTPYFNRPNVGNGQGRQGAAAVVVP